MANTIYDLLIMAGKSEFQAAKHTCGADINFAGLWRAIFKQLTITRRDSDQLTMDGLLPENLGSEDIRETFQSADSPSIIIIDEVGRIAATDTAVLLADTVKSLSDNSVSTTLVLVGVAPGFGQWTPIQGISGYPQSMPGADVIPRAININGHIAGEHDIPNPRAILSTNPNSPAVDLGTIGNQRTISAANAINKNDWVVGYSEYQADAGLHAFLCNGSTMIDLNNRLINGAGWNLVEATGINDNGQIVGWGSYNGQTKIAFLLTPTRSPAGTALPCQSRIVLP